MCLSESVSLCWGKCVCVLSKRVCLCVGVIVCLCVGVCDFWKANEKKDFTQGLALDRLIIS